MPNAVDELAKNKAILGRVSTPADLIGATTFLASERSNYITGQNLDGGWWREDGLAVTSCPA